MFSEKQTDTIESKIQKIAVNVRNSIMQEQVPDNLILDSLAGIEQAFAEEFRFKNVAIYAHYLKNPNTGQLAPFSRELLHKWHSHTAWQQQLKSLYEESTRQEPAAEFFLTKQPVTFVLLNMMPYQTWWDAESYDGLVEDGVFDSEFKMRMECMYKLEKCTGLAKLLNLDGIVFNINSKYSELSKESAASGKADYSKFIESLNEAEEKIAFHPNYNETLQKLLEKNISLESFDRWNKGLIFPLAEGIYISMEWPTDKSYVGKQIPQHKIDKAMKILTLTSSIILGLSIAEHISKRSKEMVTQIVGGRGAEHYLRNITPSGDYEQVTVIMADIRDFTPISEKLGPKETLQLLNDYLSHMTEVIINHDGVVDKFVGDGIMAYWGAPNHIEDHAKLCCNAALNMRRELYSLKPKWALLGYPDIDFRIGISSGEVIAGIIGSPRRNSYTIIGDPANIASRLELANKDMGTTMMLDEATEHQLEEDFLLRWLGRLTISGISERVNTYELICRLEDADAKLVNRISSFEKGVEMYFAEKLDEAHLIFKELAGFGDMPSLMYANRCEALKKGPSRATREIVLRKA